MKKLLFFALAASCAMTVGAQNVFTELVPSAGTNADRGDFAVADIDGDGDMDIIFSATNPDQAGVEIGAVWINDGSGNFTEQQGDRVVKMGRSGNIEYGDINGDGALDLVFAGWRNGSSTTQRGIALGDGKGNFTLADKAQYPFIESYTYKLDEGTDAARDTVIYVDKVTSCGFGDFNLDGLLDYYLFANYTDDCDGSNDTWQTNNIIYFQNTDGSFTANTTCIPASARKFNETGASVIDFNADGYPDFWLCTNDENSSTVRINLLYLNNGDGTFRELSIADGIVYNKSNGTASWGDVDGDGYLDLLLNGDGYLKTGENSDRMWRLYKNSNGEGISMVYDFGGEVARQNSVNNGSYLVDWDGDGVLDLVTAGWSGTRNSQVLDWWKANDNSAMTAYTMQSFGEGALGFSEQGLRVADLDGDGKPDMLANGYSNGGGRKTGWIRNTSASAAAVPAAPTALAATVDGSRVSFTWQAPEGFASASGVTYNLSLRNTTTGKWLYNPMAKAETGWRTVAGRMGNVFTNTSYALTLPDGEYEWTVQAINGQYMGGAFAEAKTFTVGEGQGTGVDAVAALGADVLVDGRQLTVRGDASRDMTVAVYAVNGAKVQEQTFTGEAQLTLAAQGAFLVEVRAEGFTPYRTKVIAQ